MLRKLVKIAIGNLVLFRVMEATGSLSSHTDIQHFAAQQVCHGAVVAKGAVSGSHGHGIGRQRRRQRSQTQFSTYSRHAQEPYPPTKRARKRTSSRSSGVLVAIVRLVSELALLLSVVALASFRRFGQDMGTIPSTSIKRSARECNIYSWLHDCKLVLCSNSWRARRIGWCAIFSLRLVFHRSSLLLLLLQPTSRANDGFLAIRCEMNIAMVATRYAISLDCDSQLSNPETLHCELRCSR